MVNSCPTCGFKSFTPTSLVPPKKTAHIRDLLRAHAEPPEHLQSTISELSSELTRYDNERARYDEEIARLRAVLSAVESEHTTLLAERAALQAYHDDCRGLSLRSPARRLPVEILLAIFRLSSKSFPPTVALWADREKHRHAHAPLFAVSQVCARWHDIVMGTASLWSTIDFPQNVWEDLHPEKMLALLKTVIERGAGSALHVVLPPRGTASAKAVDLLAKHSARWKTAAFTGRFAGLERLSKGRFPLLESLELHLVEAPATGDLFHISQTTSPATAEFGMRRRHVTKSNCSSIVNGGFIPWDNMSPCTSTYLERFPASYSPRSAPDVTDMLANLTLPCLENLTFRSDYSSPLPWPHADFLALSSRSSFHTHLLSLNISDFAIAAAELAECLSALPSLQWLEISDDHRDGVEPIITNSLLSSLALQSDLSETLLPHLRHIVFRRSRLQFDDNVFLSFLLSRVSHRQDQSAPAFEVAVSRLRGTCCGGVLHEQNPSPPEI
ncbi:F-box domain-containing protein [Mycena sanguinolenta]|uniref:F-box domain-containing protein n=1 Tax=Mycena sanguinolenta TaxID=230812 RepID=A0A8H6YTA4_9AGAR|nr:F-box domain-containing protein [Mycena sanguinolenta]